MKAMVLPNDFRAEGRNQEKSAFYKTPNKWLTALFLSSISGVITGLVGLIINALSLLGFLENAQHIKSLGIWLIVVTFPLGALTAHCFDKMEETQKAAKRDRCERREISGEDCR